MVKVCRGIGRVCLDGSDWRLAGYWPNAWRLSKSKELGADLGPILPPCDAIVPGEVQLQLMRAGEIGDINAGLQSRLAEWVEHWEWVYTRKIVVPDSFYGQRVFLEFDALDYSGTIAVDGVPVLKFEGTHLPHSVEITGKVVPGEEFSLSVLFETPPKLFGQLGFTYEAKTFKPRYNYVWDWLARTVSIGIAGSSYLTAYKPVRILECLVNTTYDASVKGIPQGEVRLVGTVEGYSAGNSLEARCVLSITNSTVAECAAWITENRFEVCLTVDNPSLWWPNGLGDQNLYELRLSVAHEGAVIDERWWQLGFRELRWLPTPGAPASARPSTLSVNGRTIYLRGANWVPLSPFPGGITKDDYSQAIEQYKAMNVNLLRVWGGAILEREEFYEACDKAGVMVWQEFPLSSAGCSDFPPDDPETVAVMSHIVESMVSRRCHHACHLLWCGGNELAVGFDGKPQGREVPIETSHPMISEMLKIVERLDPQKKFIPTSGHGPRAFAVEGDFGKGVHHDVHGHWAYLGPETHYTYYNGDDAIWRSEVGVPGATSSSLMKRYADGNAPWPPDKTNKLWLHHGAWWIGWDLMSRMFGDWDASDESQLEEYLACSRYLQAEGYRYVLESCRRRFPRCSLNTIWMGHDCFWTTSNNSVVEVDGSCKPAWSFCQRAFGRVKVSLQYPQCYAVPGEKMPASVWVLSDVDAQGVLKVKLRTASGEILEACEYSAAISSNIASKLLDMSIDCPDVPFGLIFVELELKLNTDAVASKDVYIFGQQSDHPFGALRRLPDASLAVRLLSSEITDAMPDDIEVIVKNEGQVAAVMVELAGGRMATQGSAVTLFPGEEAVMSAQSCQPGVLLRDLKVQCLNAEIIQIERCLTR